MLITSLDYSKYVGRIAVGRVHRGELKEGQDVMLCKRDGSMVKSRIKEVDVFEGLGRTKVDSGNTCSLVHQCIFLFSYVSYSFIGIK